MLKNKFYLFFNIACKTYKKIYSEHYKNIIKQIKNTISKTIKIYLKIQKLNLKKYIK